jgi:hypothetical protein
VAAVNTAQQELLAVLIRLLTADSVSVMLVVRLMYQVATSPAAVVVALEQ